MITTGCTRLGSALCFAVLVSSAFAVQESASVAPSNSVRCVALGTRETDINTEGADGGLLIRELFRQALLMAGRDLGLATRDATLREPLASGIGTAPLSLDITVTAVAKKHVVLDIRAGRGDDARQVWQHELDLSDAHPIDYQELTKIAERLSRQEFNALFKKIGAQVSAPIHGADADLPDKAAQRLYRMTFTEQFAALRQIHGRVREFGESPALLGGLVRGYANLGKLTEFHWSTAHTAFSARALLYAERMVAREPDAPWSLWHRAYARGLAGFHGVALRDLALARERQKQKPGDDRRNAPGWVAPLEHYCRYETDDLLELADRGNASAELAEFLAFLSVEDSKATKLKVDLGWRLLGRNRECFRIVDALSGIGGSPVKRRATSEGSAALMQALPSRLTGMAGLPKTLRRLLTKDPETSDGLFIEGDASSSDRIRAIVAGLVAEGRPGQDTGEPSWAVLGRLLEDVAFAQAYRRAHFLRHSWGVPADEYITGATPLIEGHPYAAAVRILAELPRQDEQARAKLLKDVRFVDASYTMLPLIRSMSGLSGDIKARGDAAWLRAWSHMDHCTDDIPYQFRYGKKERHPSVARQLLNVSPHSPVAVAALIQHDWENVAVSADQWEREFPRDPRVLAALGKKYIELGQLDHAERCLRSYLRVSADAWAYRRLAYAYLDQGKADRWQQIMDESLQQESYGLHNAQTRREVAEYFMSQGQFQEALPYAEAAAETWAAWAMRCAAICNEGLGRWEQAETWVQRRAERYETQADDWLFWCVRTGRGDRQAAAELAGSWLKARSPRGEPDVSVINRSGVIHLLSGRKSEALACFRRSFASNNSPLPGHFVAILAHETGDFTRRDDSLRGIVEKSPSHKGSSGKLRVQLIELAALRLRCQTAGRAAAADLKRIDELIAQARSGERANVAYFAARLLEQLGMSEQAETYFHRAAHDRYQDRWTCILARDVLRSRGITPEDIKPRVSPPEH